MNQLYAVICTGDFLILLSVTEDMPDEKQPLLIPRGNNLVVVCQPGHWRNIYGPAPYTEAMAYMNDIPPAAATGD